MRSLHARAGAEAGCYEALSHLGTDRRNAGRLQRSGLMNVVRQHPLPTFERWQSLVLEETGLLPHLNPGVMSCRDELARLRPVAPSMGMMLETTSRATI